MSTNQTGQNVLKHVWCVKSDYVQQGNLFINWFQLIGIVINRWPSHFAPYGRWHNCFYFSHPPHFFFDERGDYLIFNALVVNCVGIFPYIWTFRVIWLLITHIEVKFTILTPSGTDKLRMQGRKQQQQY